MFGGWNGSKPLADLFVLETQEAAAATAAVQGRKGSAAAVAAAAAAAAGEGASGEAAGEAAAAGETAAAGGAAAGGGGGAAAAAATVYRWHRVPSSSSTPAARNNHTSAAAGSAVYIHGGHDGSQWLGDLHVLDTAAVINSRFKYAAWCSPQVSGQLPAPRACHSLSRVRQKLFLFGGYDGNKCYNDIEVLDLDTLAWIQPKVSGNHRNPKP